MKQVAPLAIATLVAIGAGLLPAFLSPQFMRPSRDEALAIIEAVADYDLRSIAAEYDVPVGPFMADADKSAHIKIIDASPCGEVEAPVKCDPIDINWRGNAGQTLASSWRGGDQQQAPDAESLLRLQVAASQQNDAIIPSGLTVALVRERVRLRQDTPVRHVRTYITPWISGDTALMQVDLDCGDMCGVGRGYALRKISGKWQVVGVQRSWIE